MSRFAALTTAHLSDSLYRVLALETELETCVALEWVLGKPNRATWARIDEAREAADAICTELAWRLANVSPNRRP
jgi:hypothetical protein